MGVIIWNANDKLHEYIPVLKSVYFKIYAVLTVASIKQNRRHKRHTDFKYETNDFAVDWFLETQQIELMVI